MPVVRSELILGGAGVLLALTTGLAASAPGGRAAAPPPSFDTQIAPLLVRSCVECHNASTRQGGLDLTRENAVRTGGSRGPAVTPGKPEASWLWKRVAAGEMPPQGALPAGEKRLLKEWIAAGARWGAGPIDPFRVTSERRAGYDWWSLQSVRQPKPPAVKRKGWPANSIDAFVLAKLESAGLQPSPPTDRTTLIRRLSFDVTGLPPTPAEVAAFLNDRAPGAYERLVDRLLASPHYGERWARHWLDVIRFGESQGFERNKLRPSAWKYRDWVVQALNDDMPYDEFVRLQVAGDVLRPNDPRAVIASGFLVMGPYDLTAYTDGTPMMKAQAREEELEGLVGTVTQTFMGLTANCARCHNHKFDPITQKEYYQLAAALGGTYHGDERESLSPEGKPQAERERQELAHRVAGLRERMAALEAPARPRAKVAAGPLPRPDGTQPQRVDRGLQALYRFGEMSGKSVAEVSASGTRLELTVDGGVMAKAGGLAVQGSPLLISPRPATKLVEACRATNEISLEAWVTPANTSQNGPARILSLSSGTGERNFTLAQAGGRYDVRLRTTATDGNGIPSLGSAEASVATRPTQVVYTRDAAGTARIYVNGKESARAKVEGEFSNWSREFRLALANETTRDRPWNGVLHLAAVYNRSLTAEEVARNFRADRDRFQAGQPAGPDARQIRASLPPHAQQEHVRLAVEISRLESRARLLAGGPAHVSQAKEPGVFHVLDRGDFRQRREPVAPSGIAAVAGVPAGWGLKPDAPEAERRKALAAWLTHPKNPLTARVIANRVWAYHFGAGLVPTPSDFGFNGGRPSHPELLDWLASDLTRNGWQLKRLHRLILLSATYRQASSFRVGSGRNPASKIRVPRETLGDPKSIDGENRLLWRQNPRRLEAEALRDAVLSVSGELDRTLGGPGFRDWTVKSQGNNEIYTVFDAVGPEFNRRSLYRMVVRAGTLPLLDVLDCPDPSVATARRTVTTTPLQALSLLNNPFMERSAGKWAERLQREAPDDRPGQIRLAYRLAYGRAAKPDEVRFGERFVAKHGLAQLCLVLLNANEFLYID